MTPPICCMAYLP